MKGKHEARSMLVIKRRAKEMITIEPLRGSDTSKTVEELFTGGAIEITLLEVGQNEVKVAINAPVELQIWRGHAPIDRSLDQEVA
jgi:sRNA-binding carbon storage regulator CsrA